MINPECLITYESLLSKGRGGRGFVIRRLPIDQEWAAFMAELEDQICEEFEEVKSVVFTSIQPLP